MIALLYAAVMMILTIFGINLLWMSLVAVRHQGSKLDSNKAFPPKNLSKEMPNVTIQIPLYNEIVVAKRVIDACASITYPSHRLQIQVLDDSTDETTSITQEAVSKWKARGINIECIRRVERKGFKAGALAHGLESASGELIAVFDADFVPPNDFLLSLVHKMDDPNLGMIQVRWSHLNANASLLTQIQAWSLDMHFVIEHVARNATGCFINFNGTAGLWKRRCIEESGGWHADTLAEDLDLSYRAQLKGWKFEYVNELESPAELPETLSALRVQQSRWTKGTAETARKLLRTLWHATLPLKTKLQGTIHLTSHIAYPCLIVAALLHPLVLMQQETGTGPGDIYFGLMGFGLFGLLGFFLAQILAQHKLYPGLWKHIRTFPIFLAGSMSLAICNTRALWGAVRKFPTPFERTPKAKGKYQVKMSILIVVLEALMAIYCVAGLSYLLWEGIWSAVGFQMIFAMSYIFITRYNIIELRSQS